MSTARLRQSHETRITVLEERADSHDKMKVQLDEIYTAFKNAKMIYRFFNRFWSKALGALLAFVGFLAAGLTVWEKAAALLHH